MYKRQAFVGRFSEHHAFLLGKMLARIDAIDADLADLDAQIDALISPFGCLLYTSRCV